MSRLGGRCLSLSLVLAVAVLAAHPGTVYAWWLTPFNRMLADAVAQGSAREALPSLEPEGAMSAARRPKPPLDLSKAAASARYGKRHLPEVEAMTADEVDDAIRYLEAMDKYYSQAARPRLVRWFKEEGGGEVKGLIVGS